VISQPILCRSFVGRVAELEHLAARRRDAAAGRGGMVLVAGEAGIGKSRLLAEFRRSLPKRTTRVASSSCREFAQRPLGPLVEILAALDQQASASLAAGAFASKVEQMAALVETFERAAGGATTIVFIEDLHWADPDLVAVLLVLAQLAADRRLLLVGTYRDDELTSGHPIFPLLGKILRERSSSLVRLAPLDDREMTQLLRDALHSAPPLPDGVLRDVRKRADGNALFGEELLRHAADRSAGAGDDALEPLPLSLETIVRERLARCEPDDRELLVRASLFGRSFDIVLLAEAFGVSIDACRNAMSRLATLQLVDRTSEESTHYRFRHALTRDAVAAELPEAQRAEPHRQIARAIATSGTGDLHVEWLAHHYALGDEHERAAAYGVAAGDAARCVHAYEDAAVWYERAAVSFASDVDSAKALVKAGLMHVLSNDVDRALDLYGRASEVYEASALFDEAIATSVMAAGALHDSGHIYAAISQLHAVNDDLGPRATREVRDRLLVRLGFLHAFARNTDNAWEVAQAIDDTTLDAMTPLAAEAHFLRGALHAQRAEPELWRAHLDRGLDIFERIDALPDNRRAALGNGALQALALGEAALARAYESRALELARTLNSGVAYESAVMAEIELRQGNLERARTLLRAGDEPTKFIARAQRAVVATTLAMLRGDDAAALVDEALLDEANSGGQFEMMTKLATVYATALEAAGREPEVERLLDRDVTVATAYDMTLPIVTIGRLRPHLIERMRAIVERAAQRPADRVNQALLPLLDAMQARHAGEAGKARDAGREAARRFADLGWPVFEAQALEAGGDHTAALKRYRAIGAHGAVRQLERLLAEEPGETRSRSLLTPREREIANAIAAGKSNRAAADALSVSEKAVEKHLTSIYAKLGLTSRAQLAAYISAGRP
jgi:DNA-binding CsgD family transcriptional regulator/tetratricopeptide (TPR) repeat protein